jgi:hypothetical protein
MAATFSAAGGNSTAVGGTTVDSGSIVVPAGAVVFAMAVSSDSTAVDCTGVAADPTGGNQALTQLGAHLNLNANGRASFWRIIAPTAGTYVFRATWGSSQGETSIGVWVGTGIDSGTPNETPVTATGTNQTPTATANTGIVAGDLVLAFGCHQYGSSSPIDYNSPSGTERGEYDDAGFSGLAFQEQVAAGTSISPQWTLGNTPANWGIFVVALNNAGAAAQAYLTMPPMHPPRGR